MIFELSKNFSDSCWTVKKMIEWNYNYEWNTQY